MRADPRVTAGLITLSGFAVVLALVTSGWSPLHTLDIGLDNHLNHWFSRHPGATSVTKAVTTGGEPGVFQALAVVAAAVLWFAHRRRLALFTLVTVPAAGLLSNLVKALVDRHRPTVDVVLSTPGGSSFPSGHATTSIVGLGVLVTVVHVLRARGRRLVTVVAALLAVLVGLSRLALGVHYASDVLGGWLLGVSWLLAATVAFGVGREPVSPAPQPPPAPREPGRPRGRSAC